MEQNSLQIKPKTMDWTLFWAFYFSFFCNYGDEAEETKKIKPKGKIGSKVGHLEQSVRQVSTTKYLKKQ